MIVFSVSGEDPAGAAAKGEKLFTAPVRGAGNIHFGAGRRLRRKLRSKEWKTS